MRLNMINVFIVARINSDPLNTTTILKEVSKKSESFYKELGRKEYIKK